MTPQLSIVIPVYNSEATLSQLIGRLQAVLEPRYPDHEIVLVDDASRDGSWTALEQLKAERGSRLRIARLLVNRGQHNAILCGLNLSRGEIVITMDDDLQNPPEEIPKLVDAIQRGFDLAIGAYDSKKHSRFRNLGGRFVDGVLRGIFQLPKDFQLTSFRAARRSVVENACRMGGVFPYITAMLFANASSYINVPVRHDPRGHGRSNYNLHRSLRLATNLLFSYSSYPVWAVLFMTALTFLFSTLFGLITLFRALSQDIAVPGWASTVVIVSLFNAITMLGLTIFGVYLARISQQLTRSRQPYVIRDLHD